MHKWVYCGYGMRNILLGIAILAVSLLVASVPGCVGCKCPEAGCDNCSATSSIGVNVLTTDNPASVSSVTASSQCSATFQDGVVSVGRLGPGSCTVWVAFATGTTEVSQVRFIAQSIACGCILTAAVGPLEPTDAAAPDGGDAE